MLLCFPILITIVIVQIPLIFQMIRFFTICHFARRANPTVRAPPVYCGRFSVGPVDYGGPREALRLAGGDSPVGLRLKTPPVGTKRKQTSYFFHILTAMPQEMHPNTLTDTTAPNALEGYTPRENTTSNTSTQSLTLSTDHSNTESKVRKPRARKKNRLSETQIKQNHVTSEKRRREIVRNIYDELVNLIPDLTEKENRSELMIYTKSINYIRWLYAKNKRLRLQLIEKNPILGKDGILNDLTWELDES